MKRKLSVFLCAVLVLAASLFALAACGKGNGEHTCTPGGAVAENKVNANCGVSGSYDEVVYCTGCKKEIRRTKKTLNQLSHNYVDKICTMCDWAEPVLGPKQYVRCDKDGNPSESGTYLLFGEYPQSVKAADVEITETKDARGYYLGSDGAYYAKVVADPRESTYKFSSGNTVVNGSVYYFKVEPLRWRILSEGKGCATILCDSIIAGMPYQSSVSLVGGKPNTTANGAPEGTSANNYAYSRVRAWLNENFYETAFDEFEQAFIRQATVDNSVGSMGVSESKFASGNTKDRVFLLSVAEVTNSAYGFVGANARDSARRLVTSDYARAIGAHMDTSDGYFGLGSWWLRSAAAYGTGATARYVYFAGTAQWDDNVEKSEYGIVPALQIFL